MKDEEIKVIWNFINNEMDHISKSELDKNSKLEKAQVAMNVGKFLANYDEYIELLQKYEFDRKYEKYER